ncbi:MAG: tetratricopeptide repeat protein [Methanoregulaceae archaeon]|jgi:tetratricopeptide (TPR) repeat protein|nr:tetratricopeptide repeat protein [Methanoregulaceae archaeon]
MQIVSRVCTLSAIILIVFVTCNLAAAADLTAEEYYNQGIDFAGLRQYTDAITSYDNATMINPGYSKAWYNRGIALFNLGRYDDAVASYDNATRFDPGYSDAWVNRGVTLGILDRYDDAIASYDKAIKINPDDPDAWYNRGNAFLYLDRYDDAIASYDRALTIYPGYTSAQQNREMALSQINKNLSSPTGTMLQQPSPTMTLPPLNQQPTMKVPLFFAPIGAIALMVVFFAWRWKN